MNQPSTVTRGSERHRRPQLDSPLAALLVRFFVAIHVLFFESSSEQRNLRDESIQDLVARSKKCQRSGSR